MEKPLGEVLRPWCRKEDYLLASASSVHRCPSSEGSSPREPRGQPGISGVGPSANLGMLQGPEVLWGP